MVVARHARQVHEPEDLWLLRTDARRYELLRGTVYVTPELNEDEHALWSTLAWHLLDYARPLNLEVLPGEQRCRAGKYTELAPDIVVVPHVERAGIFPVFEPIRSVVLAIDIGRADASDAARHRHTAFIRSGGCEWWSVDPLTRSVEIFRRGVGDATLEEREVVWQPVRGREALRLDLPALFAAVTFGQRQRKRNQRS